MEFSVAAAWHQAFPGAAVGALAMADVVNPPRHPALAQHMQAVEGALRARLASAGRAELAALPQMQAYAAYYRRWGKTYHLQLQLESVIIKGKPLGSASALVTAMWGAEIRNLLLTAGHDLDAIRGQVTLDVAAGGEAFTGLGGREQVLKPGDMLMRDGEGIISSVLHGPDHRTRLTADTRRALFTVYAPDGIGPAAVRSHLEELAANVRLVAPAARTLDLAVYAGG